MTATATGLDMAQCQEIEECLRGMLHYRMGRQLNAAIYGDDRQREMFAKNSVKNDRTDVALGRVIADIYGVEVPRLVIDEQWASAIIETLKRVGNATQPNDR